MDNSWLRQLLSVVFLFATVLFPFSPNQSQEAVIRYTIAEQSTLRIRGTSTINNFTVHAGDIQGRIQINPAVAESTSLQAIEENPMGTVRIPAEQLRGGNSLFNRDLHKSLQANIYPNISYQLTAFQPADTTSDEMEWLLIHTTGELTITRATRTVEMKVEGRWNDQKQMEFRGTKALSISEFGIDPPSRLFGALQVGDTVEVDFHIYLRSEIESDGGR